MTLRAAMMLVIAGTAFAQQPDAVSHQSAPNRVSSPEGMPLLMFDMYAVAQVNAPVCAGPPGLIRVHGYPGSDLGKNSVLAAGPRVWRAETATPSQPPSIGADPDDPVSAVWQRMQQMKARLEQLEAASAAPFVIMRYQCDSSGPVSSGLLRTDSTVTLAVVRPVTTRP